MDILKARLIPEVKPTDEEEQIIKEMKQEIEDGEWEEWEDVKKELN